MQASFGTHTEINNLYLCTAFLCVPRYEIDQKIVLLFASEEMKLIIAFVCRECLQKF